MFRIDKSEIHMTRGDSAQFTVNLVYSNGLQYTIGETEQLQFSLKKDRADDLSLQKTITGTTTFNLVPADTSELEYGRYKYDIQLLKGTDVYTVVPYADLFLEKEVG